MTYIIIVLIAYLLGSFCASIPLSKRVYGGDVREKGSGNAGATNMARVYGMKAGIATFMLDAVKTAAAMLIGAAIGGEAGKALARRGVHSRPLLAGILLVPRRKGSVRWGGARLDDGASRFRRNNCRVFRGESFNA